VDAGCRMPRGAVARRCRAHHLSGRPSGPSGQRQRTVAKEGRGTHVGREATADRRPVRDGRPPQPMS
jgi:hypothetical protein